MKEFKARSRALYPRHIPRAAHRVTLRSPPRFPPAAAHRRGAERAENKFYFIGDTIHEYD